LSPGKRSAIGAPRQDGDGPWHHEIAGGQDRRHLFRDRALGEQILRMRGIAAMFNEYEKYVPDLAIEWMYPAGDYHKMMTWYFPWPDYQFREIRETMTQEINIIVLHLWLNELPKGYMALEEYFVDRRPVREDPEPLIRFFHDPIEC
jgi:hypothetical protein